MIEPLSNGASPGMMALNRGKTRNFASQTAYHARRSTQSNGQLTPQAWNVYLDPAFHYLND
ncbi:hypothetical protein GCM10010978_22190 [Compostibacillus humi]|uniref:Uncharacterized protein n=1 Tax=Compostibacillus humi TaxID=1245525 RepID=A0A8J2TQB0_9BACI|nr:hypothetical protein GCM10010978_22190 [Compostibacillus humi]